MHVVFVEPAFPANQREFVRGLHAVGARVTGIGERPLEALTAELRDWHVPLRAGADRLSTTTRCCETVRWVQAQVAVDRLEATVEAHIMTAARVREACGIPGHLACAPRTCAATSPP